MVVKLTQEQDKFIKTFGSLEVDINKKRALYYISRFGFGHAIEDGNNQRVGVFDNTEQLKMLEAVINGYEVIVPKFIFHNFSARSDFPLYYAGSVRQLIDSKEEAREVKKDSEEYKALELLGFLKEEV